MQQRFNSIRPKRDVSINPMRFFSIPFGPDPDFVERPDITTWIKRQYTDSVSRIALVGMGGFGYTYYVNKLHWPPLLTARSKTQVIIRFAHHIHDSSPETSVYWVHASSRPRFEEAYQAIAERLQLPRRNDPKVDVLGLVRDWLQSEDAGSWLMVLDNADDVNLFYPPNASRNKVLTDAMNDNSIFARNGGEPLAAYLPKQRNGAICITSRSIDAAEKLTGSQAAIYKVTAMEDFQGLQLLRNKLVGDFDKDVGIELLQALDCIPLAITQAAAYINRRAPRASIETYLSNFRESDKKKGSLLNRDAGDIRRDEAVSNSVVTTWQVTFEQVRRERPSAAKLLSFMSFFNPQGIPEFVLHNYEIDSTEWVHSDAKADDFEEDLDVLRGYSLVSVTPTGNVCEMHALVQFCMRAWISVADNPEKWRQMFLRVMSRHFPDGAFETWPACQTLLPHLESAFEEQPPSEVILDWAYLLHNCASYMLAVGNYRGAEGLNRKAMKTRKEILGKTHLDTMASMANLASTYRNQGQLKEAEELEVDVMKIRKRLLGENHPDTLTIMANLASTYQYQGRLKEAEELDIGVMQRRKRLLGDEHPSTLTITANLASTYRNQGRLKEAEEIETGAVETGKRILGDNHPDTLMIMANLASTYRYQGRLKEAEKIDTEVIRTTKRVLGDEHPSTLIITTNLASTYRHRGRWREAEELEVGVVEMRRKVLGDEHPFTLVCMANLASTYWSQGRLKKAEELEVRVVETMKRLLGDEHPSTLTIMTNLASTYRSQRRLKEAEEIDKEVLEVRKRILGDKHPSTLTIMANLASTYRNQGRLKEAEELEVQAMETARTVFGDEHPYTLTIMANLASTYRRQSRRKEAEEVDMEVMEARTRILGDDHPHTLTSMNNLAITWKDQSRPEDALALMRNCVSLRQRVLGRDHPHTMSSKAWLTQWERTRAAES